ncbi:alpha/beta hydrolase family protein [Corynebacterium sp. A21]|uniref:alpha/beta hydrolase family protein n=1 Tax=Corynebacterium sp. A21 TaxID=3457318 RepID=UPI003FD0022E
MRQSYASALAPDGSAIAYIVRDGGYPYAVRAKLGESGLGAEEIVPLPIADRGSVTKVLYSPDGQWIACEGSPKGSERLVTWVVPADGNFTDVAEAKILHTQADVLTTLVEWDGAFLAMNAVTSNGVTEARLVDPRNSTMEVLDRRTDSLLIAAEQRHALMRVGPRGSRELLLVTPEGKWLPLLPPDPGSITEAGTFLSDPGEDDLAVIVCTDHNGERRRVVRLGITDDQVTETELITNGDAEVDEFVISEDLSTAAVLWNLAGISALELLALAPDQSITMRRTVELDGMVASALSITDDGLLLSLTVEGPNLPPTVEVIVTDLGHLEHLRPREDLALRIPPREHLEPELVHYTARDGLELSGWLYQGLQSEAEGEEGGVPQPTYIHLHGGPEGQSRPINHDVLTALIDSGVTVFTPNIRGSKGSGRKFQHADDRYGRFAAINDVADTAAFLIDAGVSDPARLALGGRSYGGYLSLMVAARYPELFAGIIDACGMTSFRTYFRSTEPWLASGAYPKYGYPMHDAELLMAISPLYLANQIRTPVLFLHGEWDSAVPPKESRQMQQALARRGVDTTFVLVPGEGHQFVKPRSRKLIAEAMLEFLCKQGLSSTIDLGRFQPPSVLSAETMAEPLDDAAGEGDAAEDQPVPNGGTHVVIRKGRGFQWLENR